MTPIKSLAMIMRSLEKAFLCKPHFMIMTHSKWCPLLFTCVLWDEPAIYLGVRKWGCREVEGGGVSKNRKTKSCTRKEGEKIGIQGSMETFMQVSPQFWDLYNGNVRNWKCSFYPESYSNEKC